MPELFFGGVCLLLGALACLAIDWAIELSGRRAARHQAVKNPPRQPVRYQRVRSNEKAEWKRCWKLSMGDTAHDKGKRKGPIRTRRPSTADRGPKPPRRATFSIAQSSGKHKEELFLNPMKDCLAIMDEVLGAITQTEIWNNIQLTNPAILAADKQFNDELAKLSDSISKQSILAIESAAIGLTNAFTDAAILYGLQVAIAIQEVTANPNTLAQYIMDRVAARNGR